MGFTFNTIREPIRFSIENKFRKYFSKHLLNLNPNMFSWLNLTFSLFAGVAIYNHNLLLTIILYTSAIISDGLDGIVARGANKSSLYGNFLDSSIDRIGEGLFLLGLILSGIYPISIIFVIAITSIITPFLHTQLILHGVKFKSSLFEKGDRILFMLFLFIMSFIFSKPLTTLILLIAILNSISVIQLFIRGKKIRHNLSAPADPDETTIDDEYYQGREFYST